MLFLYIWKEKNWEARVGPQEEKLQTYSKDQHHGAWDVGEFSPQFQLENMIIQLFNFFSDGRKIMYWVLVNRWVGLSLSRKSVFRLTIPTWLYIAIYRGRHTATTTETTSSTIKCRLVWFMSHNPSIYTIYSVNYFKPFSSYMYLM